MIVCRVARVVFVVPLVLSLNPHRKRVYTSMTSTTVWKPPAPIGIDK